MDALLLNLMSRKMQVLNAVMREGVPPLNRSDVPGTAHARSQNRRRIGSKKMA
jgi:hypothetical protein